MADRNANQGRPEQNKGQSGINQGNRPFPPGGIDKDERKGRETSEGGLRDSRDAEMDRDRQAGPSREPGSRDTSRDSQTGERQPSTSQRSGSEPTQRATQGQDMTRGSSAKVNESRRPEDRKKEDVDRDERKNFPDRDRKDSSH